jgi:hypothetical protein
VRDVFNCDYVIACLGLPNSRARFIGVYRVDGRRPGVEVPPPKDFPYREILFPSGAVAPNDVWYDLVKVSGFDELEEVVVIDWGRSPKAWAQWAVIDRDKRILEHPALLR